MQTNQEDKPLYKDIPRLYYVCSLIAMGFGILRLLSGFIKDYLPIPNQINVDAFQNTLDSDNKYLWIISITQVIVVIVLILSGYLEMKIKTKQTDKTIIMKQHMNKSLNRLVKGISFISLSWILLYLWFTYFWSIQPKFLFGLNSIVVFWIVADIFHTLTAFFFFYCFSSLEYPNKSIDNEIYKKQRITNNLYVFLLSVGFLMFSIAGRFGLWNMEKLGPILLSFWVALSMQFFFGKLDSFDLKVPRILIAPLYLYVLLQMMWSAISGYLSIRETLFILILTLLFKIYFLLLFQYWIRSNTFHRYFQRFARDPSKVKKIKNEFIQN